MSDEIRTRPATQEYRDGWERTFGRKDVARCPYGGEDTPSSCALPAGHSGGHERRKEHAPKVKEREPSLVSYATGLPPARNRTWHAGCGKGESDG